MQMVGPGGLNGCSRFNCLQTGSTTFTYEVAWPSRDVYTLVYKMCTEHEQTHRDNQRHYPHMTLIGES